MSSSGAPHDTYRRPIGDPHGRAPAIARLSPSAAGFLKDKLVPTVSKLERAMIRLALQDHRSNLDAAARTLGIARKGL